MHLTEAKQILSAHNGMNLYRGCTHGCIYCDSRSHCYQMDHDFEDVAVKYKAPELLAEALRKKRKPCMIGTGAMSDPYIPLERELRLTRRCLEIIANHGFGLAIHTKSERILDDLPLLLAIHERARCVVQMTITTYDDALCGRIEPQVSLTSARLNTLHRLREAGIPTVVWLSPLLPFINDTRANVGAILAACAEAGVGGIVSFGMGVTLRAGNREYFYAQLDKSFPGIRARYEKHFGYAYSCLSANNSALMRFASDFCAERHMCFGAENVLNALRQMPSREPRLF